MNQYTLLIASLFAFVAAAIYTYIGRQLGQRPVTGREAKLAWQLFTVWWYGLGLTTLIGLKVAKLSPGQDKWRVALE